VYVIKPKDGNYSFPVYCDQTTAIGAWIVIQKRFDGSVRFSNRTWVEYQNGFGNLTGEFWLGLDKIHLLTKTPVRIRFDLGAPDGTNRFAAYQGFTIAGADQKYKLTSGKYIGNDIVNSHLQRLLGSAKITLLLSFHHGTCPTVFGLLACLLLIHFFWLSVCLRVSASISLFVLRFHLIASCMFVSLLVLFCFVFCLL